MRFRTVLFATLLLILAEVSMIPCVFSQALTVTSPDHKISLSFDLKSLSAPYASDQRAYYRVSYEGTPVLTDSPLGLDFLGAPALNHDFSIQSSSMASHDSSWQDRINDNLTVRDHYNQLT